MTNLNQKILLTSVVAIPPSAEQDRIVAKVDELMELCDQLEAQQTKQTEAHERLVATLLDTLTQSADAAAFADNWARIAEQFDLLFETPESIDKLKQTILQLAVQGKLVPQDRNDEGATELLKRIAAAKARLAPSGKIKKDKPLSEISVGELQFSLPVGWFCQQLDSLVLISGGITLGRQLTGRKLVSRPYLRVANVQRGFLVLDHVKDIEIPEDEVSRFELQDGDLLITEGGDWDKVGRTAIWRCELPSCVHQNHVFKARGVIADWNPRWAAMYLNSAVARDYFAGAAKQTTNLASINMTQLRGCVMPLPPLAEQHRIVAKVEELMPVCDALTARLAAARELSSKLVAAAAEAALA